MLGMRTEAVRLRVHVAFLVPASHRPRSAIRSTRRTDWRLRATETEVSLAWLAFEVAWELAALAKSEADPRKRAHAVREANAMFKLGRTLDAAPHPPQEIDFAHEEWRAKVLGRAAEPKPTKDVSALERELAELRAELAQRDAEAHAAWAGKEE